jgi:hypothetical protein
MARESESAKRDSQNPAGVVQDGLPQQDGPMTATEARAMGLGRFIVDRSSHPSYYASSWPMLGSGFNTLGLAARYRIPHIQYNSVLVTVISNDWQEGGWWRLQNMLRYSERAGFTVALEEVDDMSTMPADAIGIMRACAAMAALDGGFEWCLMLDTDAHVEDDTLVKLLAHDRPVVYPLVIAGKNDKYRGPLSSPRLKPGIGLQPVTWATMSCMLFNTKVFNCLAPYAWHGHDYHFAQNLAHFGHRIHVDTDTVVNITRGPARHPVKTWRKFWADRKSFYERRQHEDRHREPPPGFDPAFGEGYVDSKNVYWAVEQWARVGIPDIDEETENGHKE